MDLSLSSAEQSALLQAFGCSHGMIILAPDGRILAANDNFLAMFGYGADLIGRTHDILVHPEDKHNGSYTRFWTKLLQGGVHSGEFRRLANGNRELWLNASYSALRDEKGAIVKIIEIARDITEQHYNTNDLQNQIRAINRSHAVIEFDVRGNITHANDNFLRITGYSLSEIVGRHHSIFFPPEEAREAQYASFWQDLAKGQFHQGEFRRIGKDGKPFWIRAAYNPIVNADGVVTRVMKFALDITGEVQAAHMHERAMYASESLFQEIIDQVGKIAIDIDSITRQTKLLAINARIEAARIGDEGRSFAVVASEMATLSGHTAEATSHIAKLIREGDEQSRHVISMFGAGSRPERSELALRAERG